MTREDAKQWIENLIKTMRIETSGCYPDSAYKDEVYVALDMAIEALEQKPYDDCISRQEALNVVHKYFEHYLQLNDDICLDGLRSLPSVTPKEKTGWIPVSERLPEKNEWYQCTVVVNALTWTTELFYKNGKWLDNRRINMFDTYDIYGYGSIMVKHKLSYQELISEFDWTKNVIAWMPLPEPYKVESEDKE